MPNRIMRPWTDSEAVNRLSDAAEVFFVRLIQCADDFGRFHGSPMLLKSYLFPLKDKRIADISRLVTECVQAGLIADYEVSGKRYLQIWNFGQRTRIMKSRFPEPPANVRHMTAKCQTNNRHMTARDGDGDGDGTPPCGGDSHAHNDEDIFPHSAEEVMKLAENPAIGLKCTEEQAQAYYTYRVSRGWIPTGQQKPMTSRLQICADLKWWLMRDQDNERRQLHNGDNRNNFNAKYDEADDGSIF